MPLLFREGPYEFRFYAVDKGEPPHVHVRRDRQDVKFWLDPIRLAKNKGYAGHEMRTIRRLVEKREPELLNEWHDYFNP